MAAFVVQSQKDVQSFRTLVISYRDFSLPSHLYDMIVTVIDYVCKCCLCLFELSEKLESLTVS